MVAWSAPGCLAVEDVRPVAVQHERRLVHHAELERVGDLLEDRDVGSARHLVAADLVLLGVLDGVEHDLQLGRADGHPAPVRIKVGVRRVAVVKQLEAQVLEGTLDRLPGGQPRNEVAGQRHDRLGGARPEVGVVRAAHSVGAAERLAQPAGQRAAAAVELGAGVVAVLGGQVGRDLGKPVPLEEVVDDDEVRQVGDPVVGQEVRQPDERVLVPQQALDLVDAEHVVGRVAAFLVKRVVDDQPDGALVGLELLDGHPLLVADVAHQDLDGTLGALPRDA